MEVILNPPMIPQHLAITFGTHHLAANEIARLYFYCNRFLQGGIVRQLRLNMEDQNGRDKDVAARKPQGPSVVGRHRGYGGAGARLPRSSRHVSAALFAVVLS